MRTARGGITAGPDADVRDRWLTAGLNTQAGIDVALAMDPPQRTVVHRRRGLGLDLDRILDLGDEIQAGLDQMMTNVARELPCEEIPRALRRPVRVLLHGPVYDATFAVAAPRGQPTRDGRRVRRLG